MIELGLIGLVTLILVVAIIGFVAGVFVYRNNVKILSPIADKIDKLEDSLRERIKELEAEIKELKNK